MSNVFVYTCPTDECVPSMETIVIWRAVVPTPGCRVCLRICDIMWIPSASLWIGTLLTLRYGTKMIPIQRRNFIAIVIIILKLVITAWWGVLHVHFVLTKRAEWTVWYDIIEVTNAIVVITTQCVYTLRYGYPSAWHICVYWVLESAVTVLFVIGWDPNDLLDEVRVLTFPTALSLAILYAWNEQPYPEDYYELYSPAQLASPIALFLIGWVKTIVTKALYQRLDPNDLYTAHQELQSVRAYTEWFARFNWNKPLIWSLLATGRYNLVCAFICAFIVDLTQALMFLVLMSFCEYLETTNNTENEAEGERSFYKALLFMSFLQLMQIFFNVHMHYHLKFAQLRASCILQYAVACRLTTVKAIYLPTIDTNEMHELITRGIQQSALIFKSVVSLWELVIFFILSTFLMIHFFEKAGLYGVLLMLGFIPLYVFLTFQETQLETRLKYLSNRRVELISEIVHNIIYINFYTWSKAFKRHLQKLRLEQIQLYTHRGYFDALHKLLSFLAPNIVCFAVFSLFLKKHSEGTILGAAPMLAALALIINLEEKIAAAAEAFININYATTLLDRLELFLKKLPDQPTEPELPITEAKIVLQNASFRWLGHSMNSLNQITLNCSDGELVLIIGGIDAGKTSVLSAIMNELELTEGEKSVSGNIIYVSDDMTLHSTALWQFVVYTSPLIIDRLKTVLQRCQVMHDVDRLRCGLSSLVDNSMSYSFRQRLIMARGVYQKREIYLFDDPLKELSERRRMEIFSATLGPRGILQKHLRVLTTTEVFMCPWADLIYYIENGRVVETGTFKQLMRRRGLLFDYIQERLEAQQTNETLNMATGVAQKPISDLEIAEVESNFVYTTENASTEMEFEDLECSSTTESHEFLLLHFPVHDKPKFDFSSVCAKSLYGFMLWRMGYCSLMIVVFLFFLTQFMKVLIDFIISRGGYSDPLFFAVDNFNRLFLNFFLLAVWTGVVNFLSTVFLTRIVLKTCNSSFNHIVDEIFKAPLWWFTQSNLRNIISACGNVMDSLEKMFGATVEVWFETFFRVFILTVFGICALKLYIFFPFLPVTYFLFKFVQGIHITRHLFLLERDIDNQNSMTIMERIRQVRFFKATSGDEYFLAFMERAINLETNAKYIGFCTRRKLRIEMELLSYIEIMICVVCVVRSLDINVANKIYFLHLLLLANKLFGDLADCAERLHSCVLSSDVLFDFSKVTLPLEKKSIFRVGTSWPSKGAIFFRRFTTRQQDDTFPYFLRGVTLDIAGGEKVSVIGERSEDVRSFSFALTRVIEKISGDLYVDGVSIHDLNRTFYRSRINIIPDDAAIFSGTLRLNMDPTKSYSDAELLSVLKLMGLLTYFNQGLDTIMDAHHQSLKPGVRLLLNLSRAILRRTNMVIFDKCLPCKDYIVDAMALQAIQTYFVHATVIVVTQDMNVARQFKTVVIVQDNRVVEKGNPKTLLRNPNSELSQLEKRLCAKADDIEDQP